MPAKRSGTVAAYWQKFPLRTGHLILDILLLAIPAAVVLHYLHAPPLVIFAAAALGIIPLAGVMGETTESLSAHTGPTLGGLLNATMGNATELIIAFFALRAGHIEVVKASLSGSIIGNILLVLGLSLLVGGMGRERQRFSRSIVGTNSTMLFIAVVALIMPAVYELSVVGSLRVPAPNIEQISLWTSGVLIAVYLVSFVFTLKTHKALFTGQDLEHGAAAMSVKSAVIGLTIATLLIAYLSEMMVEEIEPVTQALGMTELFMGVIVVAIVGNAAEHSTAIFMARRDKMDLAMTIAIGSSTQIALFVAPLLVFLSLLVGTPMSLVFNGFEIAAVVLSVIIVEMIAADGESTWFEGAQLLAIYVILAIAFYFVPAGDAAAR